ncbi:50S ribosomal protein L6 [Candidatus Bathyarchaeota archaeon]|nr:50S ribosomal protein L6 [Candidatus Bathyarchaeota archaeon]
MVRAVTVEEFVEIPLGVEVKVDGRIVNVKGPLGELRRDFSHTPVKIVVNGNNVKVSAEWPRKREAATVGTVRSHLRNMIVGVTKGFTYKLKIIFAHFPIAVRVEKDKVIIENFSGERTPRVAQIVGNTEVTVKGEDILVRGLDLEAVGQTAANIERATQIKYKDPRVFLDGIYIYEKLEGM